MQFLNKVNRFFLETLKVSVKYFYTKIITSFIIAVISYIVFRFIGIRFSALLAIILGISNIIPVFGPWAGLIVCGLIAVFQQPVYALYTTITALITQLIEQFFLIPVLAGKSLDLKPLIVVLVTIGGSLLFGFWGVLFAVPLAASVRIAYTIFFVEERAGR